MTHFTKYLLSVIYLLLSCSFSLHASPVNYIPNDVGCVPPSAPTNTTTTINQTICSGKFTTLSALGSGTLGWYSAASGGTYLGGGNNFITPTLTTNTSYYVQDSTCAASTTRTQITVTVNALPVTVITSSSSTICLGKSTTLACSNSSTYLWTPGNLTGSSVTVTPAGSTIYSVVGTSSQGCTNTASITIFVNPLPTVGSTASATTICAGTPVAISGTGASFYNYQPGALSGNTVNVTPASTTTYTVIGVNSANLCTNTSTRTITVNPVPTVANTVTASSICSGNSTTMTATGADTYVWNPGSLSGSVVTVSPIATTTYTVTGTSTAGCSKTSTRTITVTPPCSSVLNLKLYYAGYYLSGGLMNHVLLDQGAAGATASMTDTIRVELRNTTSPYAIQSSIKTVLQTNGTAVCNFPISGTYYVAIKHRNGVETWSANPLTLANGSPLTYNFSNDAAKAFGSNQKNIGGGLFAFYNGDINADENIDIGDLTALEIDINNFASGYLNTDVNGDGNVDIVDGSLVDTDVVNFVFSQHP